MVLIEFSWVGILQLPYTNSLLLLITGFLVPIAVGAWNTGVFIYLSLTFIGLLYTLFKVTMKERFFYILKTTGISFFVVISAAFTINWDVVITHYNLSEKFNPEEIDYPYLISLKEGNQHLLIEYAQAGKIPYMYWPIIKEPTKYGKSKEPTSWKSLVYAQYQKEQALRQFYAQQNNSSPIFPETE